MRQRNVRYTLDGDGRSRWLRFVIGLALSALGFAFFASGYTPPGVLGAVLRHNQTHDVDASPLFYTDVDNMPDLERELRNLRNPSPSPRDRDYSPNQRDTDWCIQE